jgi:multidrug efflux pump subunit AcrA (membrane-fusion protein)
VATAFRAADGAPLFLYYTAFDFSGAYTGTCYTARCDAKLTVPAALAPKDPVLVDMLRGGVYAEALITAIPKENVLTIPMTAISMRDDQRTCYVIEDGKAVRKILTTGYIGENLVEVLNGISEKDYVITGGLNKIREGVSVKVSEKGTDKE